MQEQTGGQWDLLWSLVRRYDKPHYGNNARVPRLVIARVQLLNAIWSAYQLLYSTELRTFRLQLFLSVPSF